MWKRRRSPDHKILRTLLVADRPLGAYDLIQAGSGGSGRLYPALHRLESEGLIVGQFEDTTEVAEGRLARRLYELTALGTQRARDDLRNDGRSTNR